MIFSGQRGRANDSLKAIKLTAVNLSVYLRACLKITKGTASKTKARGRARAKAKIDDELMASGQQNQVIRGGENLQTAGLLAVGGVGPVVTARGGDAPTPPPDPRPKSLAAVPLGIFRQALSL